MKTRAELTNAQRAVIRPNLIRKGLGFSFFLFCAMTTFFLSNVNAQTAPGRTYYIDYNSGNDNYNGISKSAPWQFAPGMRVFTGVYNHQAGDHFIFKGGVTWPYAAFPFEIVYSGSLTSPDYYGVDKTWFSGSSWTRPVFDLDYTLLLAGNGAIDIQGQSNITIDNLEIAHMAIPSSGRYGYGSVDAGSITPSNNITVENSYIHDWRPLSTYIDSDNGGIFFNGKGDIADSNTVGPGQAPDGTYNAASGSCIRNGDRVSNNNLSNCSDMYVGGASQIYGNTFGPSKNSFDQGQASDVGPYQANAIWHNNASGQTTYIYNNVFHDQDSQYQLMLLHPGWQGATNSTYYVFNNVWWNVSAGVVIDNADIAVLNSNTGAYVYNNTCSGGICLSPGNRPDIPSVSFVIAENNHWITDSWVGNGFCYNGIGDCGSAVTLIDQDNVTQSTAVAEAQGYTSASLFAPTASSDMTMGVGANLTSLGLTTLNQDKSGVHRPTNGPWDVGAYQYSRSSTPIQLFSDVNNNKSVTMADAQLTTQAVIGATTLNSAEQQAAVLQQGGE